MRKSNRSGSMDAMVAIFFLAGMLGYHLWAITVQLENINKNLAEQNKNIAPNKIIMEQSRKSH